mmetsp:Transcript_109638/g.305580  ORF Transcript_109638/g.305580 Transcript_109638/m.305580 type:complete len:347 (+) Transcript_109638:70-1110(+)
MPPIPGPPWFSYVRTASVDVDCPAPRTLQRSSWSRRSTCAVVWSAIMLCTVLTAAVALWQRRSGGPPENCPPSMLGQPPNCTAAKEPLQMTVSMYDALPSLYCASVMRSKGYEVPLMKAQVQRGVGIFSCDEHSVFADKAISLGKGVNTTAFPIAPVGVSVDGHAACVQLFLNFWGAVKRDGRFRRYDWTLKVDPDAMMLVDRVRLKLKPHTHEPLQSLFLRTCNRFPINEDFKMPYTGMYGATEAFTRPALEAFLAKHDPVCTSLPWQSWGEDNFMVICMHRLGIWHVDDWHFLADTECFGTNCADGVYAVYHHFKSEDAWLKCLWQATGSAQSLLRATHGPLSM